MVGTDVRPVPGTEAAVGRVYARLANMGIRPDALDAALRATGGVVAGSFPLQAFLGETWAYSDIDIWVRDDALADTYVTPVEPFHRVLVQAGLRLRRRHALSGDGRGLDAVRMDEGASWPLGRSDGRGVKVVAPEVSGYARLYDWVRDIYSYGDDTAGDAVDDAARGPSVQVIVFRSRGHARQGGAPGVQHTVDTLMRNFDITACQMGYAGGDTLVATAQAVAAARARRLSISAAALGSQSLLDWTRTFRRVAKYAERGFKVDGDDPDAAGGPRGLRAALERFSTRALVHLDVRDNHSYSVLLIAQQLNLFVLKWNQHVAGSGSGAGARLWLDPDRGTVLYLSLGQRTAGGNAEVLLDVSAMDLPPGWTPTQQRRFQAEWSALLKKWPEYATMAALRMGGTATEDNQAAPPRGSRVVARAVATGTCFDVLAVDDVAIRAYLDEDPRENVVLLDEASGKAVCAQRSRIHQASYRPDLVLYPCVDREDGTRWVDRDVPLARFDVPFNFYVPAGNLEEVVCGVESVAEPPLRRWSRRAPAGTGDRYGLWRIVRTHHAVPRTVSLGAANGGDAVGAWHCQESSSVHVYHLEPLGVAQPRITPGELEALKQQRDDVLAEYDREEEERRAAQQQRWVDEERAEVEAASRPAELEWEHEDDDMTLLSKAPLPLLRPWSAAVMDDARAALKDAVLAAVAAGRMLANPVFLTTASDSTLWTDFAYPQAGPGCALRVTTAAYRAGSGWDEVRVRVELWAGEEAALPFGNALLDAKRLRLQMRELWEAALQHTVSLRAAATDA